MRIGVDVDGVLADFATNARAIAKQLFDGKPEDHLVQTGWGFDSLGLNKEQESIMWNAIKGTFNFWASLKPLDNTSLLPLLARKHDLVFVTTRIPTAGAPVCKQTEDWLHRWFLLDHPNVIITNHKGNVASSLQLKAFIDDKTSNLADIHNVVVGRVPPVLYLKDAPYNQEDKRFSRVGSFNEFALKFLLGDIHE